MGREGLAALFASRGCTIVATDQSAGDAERTGWAEIEQFAGELQALNSHGICDPATFAANVSYRTVDMRAIPRDLTHFHFTWSSCAFEHLGSIAAGVRFVLDQMRCLRPGGVGVHTTEYNVASNGATIETGSTVLFRRCDLEALATTLRRQGHEVELDFTLGDTAEDRHVDRQPWSGPHLRLDIGGYVASSFALIVHKGDSGQVVLGARRLAGSALARAETAWRAVAARRSAARSVRT